jgi:hypothetical protein
MVKRRNFSLGNEEYGHVVAFRCGRTVHPVRERHSWKRVDELRPGAEFVPVTGGRKVLKPVQFDRAAGCEEEGRDDAESQRSEEFPIGRAAHGNRVAPTVRE